MSLARAPYDLSPVAHAPTLDARSFVVVADADEVISRPALLATFAETFSPDDDVTLLLASGDPGVGEAVLSAAAEIGCEPQSLPDLLLLPLDDLAAAGFALLEAGVTAALSEQVLLGPLGTLPRFGVVDGPALRRLGDAHIAASAVRSRLPVELGLPDGYVSRISPEYFDDTARADGAVVVHQPDVYAAAARLARALGCTHLIDVGAGAAEKLIPLGSDFHLIGLDFGTNLEHCRRHHPQHIWLDWDVEREPLPELPRGVVERSVVICADVIEHLVDPAGLIAGLTRLADTAQAVLISTPDRVRVRGRGDLGPPANAAHVREWSLEEFVDLLSAGGLAPAFAGHTINNDRDREKKTSLVIVDRRRAAPARKAPDDFRVTAVLPAYNEADIVEKAIRTLVADGIHVHLVDNWSTDDTVARAEALGAGGLLTVSRFPEHGPSATYDWEALLRNTERIAAEQGAGWVIHQDVDEVRESPWPGIGLRDALYHVQQLGYNAVDHTVLVFVPTDDLPFEPGEDVEQRLRHFEFGGRPGHFLQIKAWDAGVGRVDLAGSGGHEAVFPARRVFPYKFLLKHYPVRSQEHGERKVFADRTARWNQAERARGWHTHYDSIVGEHSFIRSVDGLVEATGDLYSDFLTERLTGVGLPRE